MGRVGGRHEPLRHLPVSIVLALALPFPGERTPVLVALASVIGGDVGHGPRSYWVAWDVGILAVYLGLVYVVILAVMILMRRLGRT